MFISLPSQLLPFYPSNFMFSFSFSLSPLLNK